MKNGQVNVSDKKCINFLSEKANYWKIWKKVTESQKNKRVKRHAKKELQKADIEQETKEKK